MLISKSAVTIFMTTLLITSAEVQALYEKGTYRCFHGRHELNPHKDVFSNFDIPGNCPYWIKRLSTYERPTIRYLLEAVIKKDEWTQCQYHHPKNKNDLITCHFKPVKEKYRYYQGNQVIGKYK